MERQAKNVSNGLLWTMRGRRGRRGCWHACVRASGRGRACGPGPACAYTRARACTLSILSILAKKKENSGLPPARQARQARQALVNRINGGGDGIDG
jgi:hypothetical protein